MLYDDENVIIIHYIPCLNRRTRKAVLWSGCTAQKSLFFPHYLGPCAKSSLPTIGPWPTG